MLKLFNTSSSAHIVLEVPITLDNIETLKEQFLKEYVSWHIEFGRVYSVSVEMVNLLYKMIFVENKKVQITTHKSKLNRYLHTLGFNANFDSLVTQDVVKISEVELFLIGGSADSLSKVLEILTKTTLNSSTLIIVQHVEADKKGYLDEILQKYTDYIVSYAIDGEKIQKRRIYIAPRNRHLKVKEGFFCLDDAQKYNYAKPSVSLSYESFSTYYKEKLLVIQECGYAQDGVDKLEFIKTNNSKLIIQDIDECEAKPMIQNALNIKAHDYVLKTSQIVTYLNIIDNTTTREAWIEYLLEKIYEIYSYDFRLYHKDMLNRRVDIFMLKHDIKEIKDAVVVILFNKSAFKAFFL